MKTRRSVGWLAALLLGGCSPAAIQRPDIVLILADDLGLTDVGFAGGREIQTPNLDALARRGVVLRQFYVQASCSPTRAALLTGRYPIRYGLQSGVIRPWADYGLPLSERLLPEVLRERGYTTALVGKWHLGSFEREYWPTARGFDHHYGPLLGAVDHFDHTRDGQLDWYRDGVAVREEGYSTHLLAREAVRTIENQPGDTPLFLFVAFNAVHAPLQVPEPYRQPYVHLSEPRRTYAGMVAALDEAVGQIVRATEVTGRRRRTLFVFSGDNGGPAPGVVTGASTLRGAKGTLYEGGVRTCALASWDGVLEPAREVDEPLHVVDWLPTLAALAGAPDAAPRPLDGIDIWPTLAHGRPSPHVEILLNAAPHTGALRMGDWKVVLNGDVADFDTADRERVELFNLREDPVEAVDRMAAEPGRGANMLARLKALTREAAPARHSEGPRAP